MTIPSEPSQKRLERLKLCVLLAVSLLVLVGCSNATVGQSTITTIQPPTTTPPPTERHVSISRTNLEDVWAFTFLKGTLHCLQGAVWVETLDGRVYPINDQAEARLSSIRPDLTLRDPEKVLADSYDPENRAWFIDRGLELCQHPTTTTHRTTTTRVRVTTTRGTPSDYTLVINATALAACSTALEFGGDALEYAAVSFTLWEAENTPIPSSSRDEVLRSIGRRVNEMCPEYVP